MPESEKYIRYATAKWHLYREFITDKEAAKKAFRALSAIPDADVRPVVLCKDCYWWTKQDSSLQGRCSRLGIYPTGYWFCANGQRKREAES